MITLTKEWLKQTIVELEEERDATPGAVNEDAAMALAAMKIALASLEAEKNAEPVAKVENVGVCWYADNGVPRKPAVGTELYAAPPEPVSVPKDIPDSVFEVLCQASGGGGKACDFADESGTPAAPPCFRVPNKQTTALSLSG
ncbi:TPA: hypothetical protein ACHYTI_000716 [Enterobacter hormaechei]